MSDASHSISFLRSLGAFLLATARSLHLSELAHDFRVHIRRVSGGELDALASPVPISAAKENPRLIAIKEDLDETSFKIYFFSFLKLSAQKLTEAPIRQQINNSGPCIPAEERISQVKPPPSNAAITTSMPQSTLSMYRSCHKNAHIEEPIYIYGGVGCLGTPPVMGLLWSV